MYNKAIEKASGSAGVVLTITKIFLEYLLVSVKNLDLSEDRSIGASGNVKSIEGLNVHTWNELLNYYDIQK